MRYSTSHLIPLKTFLAWTGSVVGWYGLLAPEIMEVLEASPSKPSGSSLVLMMISGETLDSGLGTLPHTNPRWQTAWIHLTAQVMFHKAHFVPCRVEVDGENKPHGPLFVATPRGNSRGRCALTLRAGKSGWNPFNVTLRCFLLVTLLRLCKLAPFITMLGGSLVQIPVSLYHGRLSLV